jgi:hypothetical protein
MSSRFKLNFNQEDDTALFVQNATDTAYIARDVLEDPGLDDREKLSAAEKLRRVADIIERAL